MLVEINILINTFFTHKTFSRKTKAFLNEITFKRETFVPQEHLSNYFSFLFKYLDNEQILCISNYYQLSLKRNCGKMFVLLFVFFSLFFFLNDQNKPFS